MKGQKFNVVYSSGPQIRQSAELSHELANVLNGLLGVAELLGESGLDTDQRRWLEAIVHSGWQMHALIQSEWNAAHPDTADPGPSPEWLDGVRLLEKVVDSHLPAVRSGNNRVYLNVGADVPRYWNCDPCLVRQLLDNLLGNAVKFTQDGDVHVEVLNRPSRREILFRISDTGPGFEPRRCVPAGVSDSGAPASSATGPRNQGLGLAICQRIITTLGGEMTIHSNPATGTRIEFSLPGIVDESSDSPRVDCSLFGLIRCRLRIAGPLMPAARNMLDRLGVAWTPGEPARPEDGLVIELSERFRGPGRGDRELVLHPLDGDDPECGARALALPLLESSLGSVLLEMVLAWRTRLLSGDNPGSVPGQRRSAPTDAPGRHRE